MEDKLFLFYFWDSFLLSICFKIYILFNFSASVNNEWINLTHISILNLVIVRSDVQS